jgi:hypothetical protein
MLHHPIVATATSTTSSDQTKTPVVVNTASSTQVISDSKAVANPPANSETKAFPVQATTTHNNKKKNQVPVPSEMEALSNDTSPTLVNIETQTVPVVQATTTSNNKKH